jgi:hypothetical protein
MEINVEVIANSIVEEVFDLGEWDFNNNQWKQFLRYIENNYRAIKSPILLHSLFLDYKITNYKLTKI